MVLLGHNERLVEEEDHMNGLYFLGRGEIYSECLKEVVALRLKELNILQELIIQVSI